MTSYPASTSNAAATELSTPPDIATRTRSLTAPHPPTSSRSSMQHRRQRPHLLHDLRQRTDYRVHVLRGVVLAEGEPQRRDAELAGHAHRRQHMRGLDRPGAAGRPGGTGDTGEIGRASCRERGNKHKHYGSAYEKERQ